jgi:hypothetical protein
VVDVVNGDRVADELEILVGEVGGQVVEAVSVPLPMSFSTCWSQIEAAAIAASTSKNSYKTDAPAFGSAERRRPLIPDY